MGNDVAQETAMATVKEVYEIDRPLSLAEGRGAWGKMLAGGF